MRTLEDLLNCNFPVIYHVIVTGRCNARCEGCINSLIYGKRDDFGKTWEKEGERSFVALKKFLERASDKRVYVALYGGEPLLVFEDLRNYVHNLREHFRDKELKFILYTNGMLLDKALEKDASFFANLSLLFVSIDGKKFQHERFRKGTCLSKIENNLRYLREISPIPVLMWSTLREDMTLRDCLDEFLGLFEKNLVDYFFWHLIEKNEPMSNFDTFREFYLRDLRYLVDLFIKYLQDSKILPILPLCELLFFLLNDIRRGQTACGVEKGRNYDIVSGKVIPCVDYGDEIVVAELKSDELIFNDDNQVQGAFRNLITYKREFGCRECEAEFFCGGRCPVLVKTSPKRAKQYCYLTRDFLALVKASLSTIKEVMATKNITDEMLYYPYGYLNLLTDVVP